MPLAERATITIGIPTRQSELFAPLQLAAAKGEFEAENLDVRIETVAPSDFYTLLADGTIDITYAGQGAMYNTLDQDFEIRWALGLYAGVDQPGAGYWARSGFEVSDLEGSTIASATGPGSAVILPLYDGMEAAGLDISSVRQTQVPGTEIVTALRNGAADVAVVGQDVQDQVIDNPDFTFLFPSAPVGEAGSGLVFGADLMANRDAAVAFVRAYVRTISTYFDGDYKADDEFMAELSEVIDVPVENLRVVPSLVWDYEIRRGMSDRLQHAFLDTGALSYTEFIPEDEVVDRSLLEDAVGSTYP